MTVGDIPGFSGFECLPSMSFFQNGILTSSPAVCILLAMYIYIYIICIYLILQDGLWDRFGTWLKGVPISTMVMWRI